MAAKRFFLGILALVVFGIFLINVGRFDSVVRIAAEVLPSPAPASDGLLPDALVDPFKDSGLLGDGDVLAANKVVVMLDAIPATGSGPLPKYDRDLFGPSWSDVDHNGCDTRNDILKRDLSDVTFREGTHDCVIIAGDFDDRYTGLHLVFAKAEASKVQIDHMVPLSWAWKNGASSWSADKRLQFANDPLNLLAVQGSANMSKGDSGPSEWLPSNTAYQCEYLAHFVLVVETYDLTIDERDRSSARRQLAGCS